MSLMLDEHRLYLSDRIRTSLFRRAIKAVVKPGDVVLDLSCGTGVLGMLAMKAGAARLYQIDVTSMIQIARDVARAVKHLDQIAIEGGTSLTLLVLACHEEDTTGVDLASGALVRVRVHWPEEHGPDLAPFDVVETQLAAEP